MNKASAGDVIPAELFQILKDDAVKVLHSVCQPIWTTQQWPQDWKRSVFIPIPKKGNAKECSSESESEVAQSCPTLSDPMDCSLPGSSIHGIFQARVLEWGANYCTLVLISHTSKLMLKILPARLQLYINHELPDV